MFLNHVLSSLLPDKTDQHYCCAKEAGSSVIILLYIWCITTVKTALCVICIMTTFSKDADTGDDVLLPVKLQCCVL